VLLLLPTPSAAVRPLHLLPPKLLLPKLLPPKLLPPKLLLLYNFLAAASHAAAAGSLGWYHAGSLKDRGAALS
jgi:hypothetical protein